VRSTSVLFVCLGNICRSPTAHGVFETLVLKHGLAEKIAVDSCGTGDWHIGHAPDGRASAEAIQRGYDLNHLRARQIRRADFDHFDFILAMDKQNLEDLQAMCPSHFNGRLELFLGFADGNGPLEVPDPYYGGDDGFTTVLNLIESASAGLLHEICRDAASD
jgi:protein-tyrosine phosphatase